MSKERIDALVLAQLNAADLARCECSCRSQQRVAQTVLTWRCQEMILEHEREALEALLSQPWARRELKLGLRWAKRCGLQQLLRVGRTLELSLLTKRRLERRTVSLQRLTRSGPQQGQMELQLGLRRLQLRVTWSEQNVFVRLIEARLQCRCDDTYLLDLMHVSRSPFVHVYGLPLRERKLLDAGPSMGLQRGQDLEEALKEGLYCVVALRLAPRGASGVRSLNLERARIFLR